MIHSACIKNTLTKCKTLIGHQKLLEVSMFTLADTISIPTSRLKENIPEHALGLQSSAVQDCFKLCPHQCIAVYTLYHRIFTNEFNPSF